jgi:uncharacterized protein (TIGR02246 family)
MRRFLAAAALLAAPAGPLGASQAMPALTEAPTDTMPAAVVQRFVDAANARDAAAMAKLVAPEAVFATFPEARTLVQGRDSIRAYYVRQLRAVPPAFRITVHPRIVEGSLVVDQEHFAGMPEGRQQATWMYEVQGGLIRRAWGLDRRPAP